MSGCLLPRFPQDVETGFARGRMRTAETTHVRAYFPEEGRDNAVRTLARLEQCVEELRKKPLREGEREKLQVFFTTSNFNNAYVQPRIAGLPQQMVLPEQLTLELFHLLGLAGGEVGDVSCHEAVHYVHMQQAHGFWRLANDLLGNVHQPNSLVDTWFLEGLATWYESRLGRRVGRPENPLWRGMFQSYAASHRLNAGHLNALHREHLPFGAQYVVGQHFVEWLARRHGEEKLWAFVDDQGGAVFSPLWVTLRFRSVFGASIGAEFDTFGEELAASLPPRRRGQNQRVLVDSPRPYFARLAAAPDGSFAVWSSALDDVNRLTVHGPDGATRWSRRMAQVLPGRDWISTSPLAVSGLSFSADGRRLGYALSDVTELGNELTRLFVLDAATGDVVHEWGGFVGMGGSLSPDGSRFLVVAQEGSTSRIEAVTLATGAREILVSFSGPTTVAAPAWSPDGTKVAFSRWMGEGFDLWLRTADGALVPITRDGRFNYQPRWEDDASLVLLRDTDGRAQPWRYALASGELTQVGEVPWAALDPQPLRSGAVLLLNRESAHFTVDRLEPSPSPRTAVAAPVSPVPATAAAVPPPPVTLLSDEPYSAWDNLLIPALRVPFIGASESGGGLVPYYFLGLSGADRLGLHNYALTLESVDGPSLPSVSLTYANYLAAPWLISAEAAFVARRDVRDWSAALSAGRTFFTWPVSFGLRGIQRTAGASPAPDFEPTRAVGPTAAIGWFGGESTPYGGVQRGFALSASAAWYPRALGSTEALADLRGEADAWLPFPPAWRNELQVSALARAVASERGKLLRVGGGGSVAGAQFGRPGENQPERGAPVAPGLAFTESLRGYEDSTFNARWMAGASARLRHAFVVDHGWASGLYLLPAFFIRQVDVEGFGTAAWLDADVRGGTWLPAAGGQVALRTQVGLYPASLVYQFAWRFRGDLGPLHVVGVAFE
ncbi:MAG: hypothetical protein RL653_290 [Pseudomonadota bacterium]|jgi:hypothetical protein